MSDSAPKHFADIASALGPLLDNYKQEKANQTLLTLFDLGEQLPKDSSLRKVINSQITFILNSDFPINPDTTNKTMVIIGLVKDSLEPGDQAHKKLEDQLARVLEFKISKINGQSSSSNSSNFSAPKPEPAPEPKPQPKPEPTPEAKPAENKAEAKPEPAPAPEPVDEMADAVHKLQISLDQMSEATRKAFTEFAPIYENGGTVKAYVEHLKSSKDGQASVKSEIEKLQVLADKIEAAPPEADEFQVLYDQVDAKHKDPKTGVFSIFQRDYGGNARRFVVERTAQYAKYVAADESRQRMIEDLHKLMEQAQKNVAENPNNAASGASSDNKGGNNNRSFFHG